MTRIETSSPRPMILAALMGLATAAAVPAPSGAADPPADSPMVKLLKSGRVPEERQGTVIKMIGQRGSAADLDYIFRRALDTGAPMAIRTKALDALAEAATTRGLKPETGRDKLAGVLEVSIVPPGLPLREPASRLAGAWKIREALVHLQALARAASPDQPGVRVAAIDAIAAIGGPEGRAHLEGLARTGSPMPVRVLALAALTRLDPEAAAARAAAFLPEAVAQGADLAPLMEAFQNRRGGGALLAKALSGRPIPTDAAKLALRAAYSLSQSDPALIEALGKAAGIATEVKPPSPAELSALVAEVAAKGDPARGEAVFRRHDLNCMTCHSVARAGGEIGPDLSSVGQTSPPDYIINSILLPDQSIKEQYHTLIVHTDDGQVYQGIVVDRDARKVILKESTGALRTVPVDSIEGQKAGGSLMPKGLVNLMTHAEFVDLVRFLSELGKPGPYAIRTTPTIQRWRVLRSVPGPLAETVPDADMLREQLLKAPPDRWAPAYARVSGPLPLDEAAEVGGGGPVLYLQGELDVTAAGDIRVSPRSPEGIRIWVDDLPAPAGTAEYTTSVVPGRHPITVRVDLRERPRRELTIEVARPSGSTAEYTVVGGK